MSVKYSARDEKFQKTKFMTLQNCLGESKHRVINTTLIESVKIIGFSDEEKCRFDSPTLIKGLTFKLSDGEEITTMSVDIGNNKFVLDLYYNGDCTPVKGAFELSDILNSITMRG